MAYYEQDNQFKIRGYNISNNQGPNPADENDLSYVVNQYDYPVDMQISDDGKAIFVLTHSNENSPGSIYVFLLP